MHFRCPHCRNPVELVVQDVLEEIVCPSCGSHFHLISGGTADTRPAGGARKIAHYELIEQVGIGHFGSVWKAHDTKLDRTVAVKIPRREQLDPIRAGQFLREARTAAQVTHPNIVAVYDAGQEGDSIYIVSEFIQGASLSQWLTAEKPTPKEAAELCLKIAAALHAAHEAGIVHRDLKPGNIMLDSKGEPHITDFGLAKREGGEITITVEGQILGTPAYMPPEQAGGKGHAADRRSDVYSLGVILFELLSGELPFRGDVRMLIVQILRDEPPSPRRIASGVPRDLETICLRCLEKEPNKRYQTAGELADELQRFLAGEPIRSRPIGTPTRLWRWCRRQPVVAALLAAVLLTLTSGIAVSSFFAVEASRRARDAEDALELTIFFRDFIPLDKANLADHAQNVQRILAFVDAKPLRFARHPMIVQRQEEEQKRLLQKLDDALARNELSLVTRLLAGEPGFRKVFRLLNERSDSRQLLDRFREAFELNLVVPPPVGRGQLVLHAIQSLLAIDPDNAPAAAAAEALRKLKQSMPIVYFENFDRYDFGQHPPDWKGEFGSERNEICGPSQALLVTSTDANHGFSRRTLDVRANAVSLEFRLRLETDSGRLEHKHLGAVHLAVGKEGASYGLLARDGMFGYAYRTRDGKTEEACVKPALLGRDYKVELRYFTDRNTYDVLVDGEFLVEEASTQARQAFEYVEIRSQGSLRVLVDELVVRVCDAPVKQDLGDLVPLTTLHKLNLRAVRSIPLWTPSVVVADVERDGSTEIVAGDHSPEGKGQIIFGRISGKDLRWTLVRRAKLDADYAFAPVGMAGELLAVHGYGIPKEKQDGPLGFADLKSSFRLLRIGEDLSVYTAFAKEYPLTYGCQLAPLQYGGGRHGLVAAFGWQVNGMELWEEVPAGADSPVRGLGTYHQLGGPLASSIGSIAVHDWNGDGQDDVFLGWSGWHGFCPAVVVLQNGEPGPVQRLTKEEWVGETEIALSCLDTNSPHLIATSARSPDGQGNIIAGYGLRVWRLGTEKADLIHFEGGDFVRVAAGVVGGQSIFATTRRETLAETPPVQNVILEAFRLQQGTVERIWQTKLFQVDIPKADARLYFADLNADGSQELLVTLENHGILVFALAN